MSLRLILGRQGSGKTHFYMNEVATLSSAPWIIVPEQYSFTAEKRLTEKTGVHGLGGAEIFSFKRLAHRLLSTGEGAALRRVDACGKVMLITKILYEKKGKLSALRGLSGEGSTAQETAELFTEFKRYGVTPEALCEMAEKTEGKLSDKLSDLAVIYGDYERLIKEKYIDGDDDLTRLSFVLPEYAKDREIYIDGFDGFTPTEFACIEKMLTSAKRVTVMLDMDSSDLSKPEFYAVAKTVHRLENAAAELNVKIESRVCLSSEKEQGLPAVLADRYFKYPTEVYENETDLINIFAAKNVYSEIHAAANKIVELCRDKGYMYRDIAVVSGNADVFEKYIKIIFDEYKIKYFLDRRVNILNHPVSVFVLSALEVIAKGYTREAIFRWAKSGFVRIPAEEIDILENYVLATGIRGDIWKNDEKWDVRASLYCAQSHFDNSEEEEIEVADRARRKIIAPLLKLEKELKEGKTAAEKCMVVYKFTEDMKVKRRILAMAKLLSKTGNLAEAEEYKSVYSRLMDALDGAVDAFGDDNVGINKFYEILKTGLDAYDAAIVPAALDGVSIGQASRVNGYDVKALFIIGANDGVFPAALSGGGILCEDDRRVLCQQGMEIAPDMSIKCTEQQYLIYKTLAMPKERLYVSYSVADFDGAAQRPSQVPARIKELFPKAKCEGDIVNPVPVNRINSPDVALGRVIEQLASGKGETGGLYGWFMQKPEYRDRLETASRALLYKNTGKRLSNEVTDRLWGKEIRMSVSRLEQYARCPFSYFIQYTLRAKERRVLGLKNADAGSFLHDFIDIFSRRLVQNGTSWREVDDQYIETETKEIMEDLQQKLNTYAISKSRRYYYIFERLTDVVRRSVKNISEHVKRGEFEPVGYELSFAENGDFKPLSIPLPNGAEVTLTGRIDRVDAMTGEEGSFIRVIDYKSGAKEFKLDEVFYGLNLQLGVYMTAICDNKSDMPGPVKPAAMLYYRLYNPVIDVNNPNDMAEVVTSRRKKMKLNGLILSDPEIIGKMDKGISGSSDFLPVRINKNGSASGVTGEQFNVLSRHIKRRVKELSAALSSGRTDIAPYMKNKHTPCEFCDYMSICGFDTKTPGCSYRRIGITDNDELWQKMRGEQDEN